MWPVWLHCLTVRFRSSQSRQNWPFLAFFNQLLSIENANLDRLKATFWTIFKHCENKYFKKTDNFNSVPEKQNFQKISAPAFSRVARNFWDSSGAKRNRRCGVSLGEIRTPNASPKTVLEREPNRNFRAINNSSSFSFPSLCYFLERTTWVTNCHLAKVPKTLTSNLQW